MSNVFCFQIRSHNSHDCQILRPRVIACDQKHLMCSFNFLPHLCKAWLDYPTMPQFHRGCRSWVGNCPPNFAGALATYFLLQIRMFYLFTHQCQSSLLRPCFIIQIFQLKMRRNTNNLPRIRWKCYFSPNSNPKKGRDSAYKATMVIFDTYKVFLQSNWGPFPQKR